MPKNCLFIAGMVISAKLWHNGRILGGEHLQAVNQFSDVLGEIRNILLRIQPECMSGVPGTKFIRRLQNERSKTCFDQPLACLTAQGHKIIHAGPHELETGPGRLLVTSVDMPSTSAILDASPENPYLCVCVYLDRKILADILAEMPDATASAGHSDPSAWIMQAGANFLDAFLRLCRLSENPAYARILAPLIIREIHFLLLASPGGGCLRNLYMRGARDSRIIDTIAWLKQNLTAPISMESLAGMAHMSISSFHRHFKTLTGHSPLQYQKKLRLYEAQRLMLAEDMRVAEAALTVGYESVTQFNREYRRMFGAPPRRDISRLKNRLTS